MVGVRPFRPEGVKHERQSLSSRQVLYHDYGHGGSGVTFSWGCATSAVQDYEGQLQRVLAKEASGNRPPATCDVSIEVGHFELTDVTQGSWIAPSKRSTRR